VTIEQPEYVEKDKDWLALNEKVPIGMIEVPGNPLVHSIRRILCMGKHDDETTYCLTIFHSPDD
jgi:hypothetical protein